MAKDLEKLLGGYATGTLTKQERETLFEAALDNQQLFNALADEEALKELLEAPESRQHLLDLLEAGNSIAHPGRLTLLVEWFRKPFNLTLAGGIATAAIAVFVFGNLVREKPQQFATPRVSETTEDAGQEQSTLAEPKRESSPAAPLEIASSPPPPPSPPAFDSKLSQRVREAPVNAPAASGQAEAPIADFRDSKQSAEAQYRLSLVQPFVDGPARQLFYAPAARQQQRKRAARPTAAGRSAKEARRSQQLAEEQSVPPHSGFAKLQSTTTDSLRIGLRLSLEKEGPDGSYSGIKLDTPFDQRDKLRLIVVANTDGFLYIVEATNGSVRRLFLSLSDSGSGRTDAAIRKGEPVIIPLPEASLLVRDIDENRLRVILSRTVLPELATTPPTVARDETRVGDIQDPLKRARSANERNPVIYKEQADDMNYFASSAPTAAPLVIELNVTRR